jgi:glycosyltransferase involved in cell wall biosynthesis
MGSEPPRPAHDEGVPEVVSVVIPTFNRATFLPLAIDSAINQSHQPIEVIVVDDGSTDNTAEVMARRYGADRRIRYLQQPNAGVAAARNHGIRAARGEYVALLDSDDAWYPWKLELQVACLRAVPEAGMIWTELEAVSPAGDILHRRYLAVRYSAYRALEGRAIFERSLPLASVAPRLKDVVGDGRLFFGDIFSEMIMGSLVHTSTVLLRRERLVRVGGFDESLIGAGEDYDFHLRTCREGVVAFADVVSIRYVMGLPDQLTANRLAMAVNSLQTLSTAIRDHRERIMLPRSMVRTKLASAHLWVGTEYLDIGARGAAVRHFARSLARRPFRARTAALFCLALLPSNLAARLRTTYHRQRAKTAEGWSSTLRQKSRLPRTKARS